MKSNSISFEGTDGLSWSEESFLYMKMLAHRCGLDLTNYKKQAVYNRLIKRIKTLNLPDIDAYCAILRFDLEEEVTFFNLITNPTTYFFRENHHFEYLKTRLPSLITKKNKIRIWSAGCSTGEEAYSIAILLLENIKNIQKYNIKILATDINTDSLLTAQTGIYEKHRLKYLSPERLRLWFDPVKDTHTFKVNDQLRELITFQKMNLLENWSISGPFNVIFCRNVLIYFKKEVVKTILHKFNKLLEKESMLFLGFSENLIDLREEYVHEGKTIFIKK